MTPIQIMALIVAILGGIKILVLIFDPKIWFKNVVKPIYANPMITTLIGLIIAGASLWYLLKEVTIVQIFAVFLFVFGVMLIGFATVAKETLAFADRLLKKDGLKRFWLSMLIWILLIIWVFYALFA